MSVQIPGDPSTFFTEFFPRQFATHRNRYPTEDTPGAAVFEVFGVGTWSIRIQDGNLQVEAGKPADTLLQIGMSPADFSALFVERTQNELDQAGAVSDESLDAFRTLFVNEKKRKVAEGLSDTLAFSIDHDGTTRKLLITPGSGERTEPRTSIRTNLPNFLGLQSGKKNSTRLFMFGKLKIRGDMGYAMRMNGLLG